MNIIKQMIVKPKIKARYRSMTNEMIKKHGEPPNEKLLNEMEEAFVRTEIALLDMCSYPLYQKIADRINQIIDKHLDYLDARIAYYRSKQQSRHGVEQ